MATDITVPALGESITEVTILRWLKTAGEAVERHEVIVEIETDKATMELLAPESSVLSEIIKGKGEKVQIGETICRVTPGRAATRTKIPIKDAYQPRWPSYVKEVAADLAFAVFIGALTWVGVSRVWFSVFSTHLPIGLIPWVIAVVLLSLVSLDWWCWLCEHSLGPLV